MKDELRTALARDAATFGPILARLAAERGLAVTRKEGLPGDETQPIPITATPVILEETEIRRRCALAAQLASAGLKMSRAAFEGPLTREVFDGLSPLERTLAEKTFRSLDTLVTTRVDFFVNSDVHALELNATIPAMQAYSDIAAHTFLEVVGAHWKASPNDIAGWKERNGSNARALFDALMLGYAKFRDGRVPKRLALLSRPRDAQLTEQRALQKAFTQFGVEAEIVVPENLTATATEVFANGRPVDLIYRHLFVRRLEEPNLKGAELLKTLLAEPNGQRVVLLNPPASQVEVKAVFALLSQALEDQRLSELAQLTGEELDAIRTTVPWTRRFNGTALLAEVQANPDRYVLKRSWDYGGRTVFVGKARNEPSFVERVKSTYGETLSWERTCARAEADRAGGGFVVQALVETTPEDHLICSGHTQTWSQLFVDFSSYASVGLPKEPVWGGVCRGSISNIVNIVGGGGVLPLLTGDVAYEVYAAMRRCLR